MTKGNTTKEIIWKTLNESIVDGEIDFAEYRKKYGKLYTLIPHYYGGINAVAKMLGARKKSKDRKTDGTPTIRHQMAQVGIKYLHEEAGMGFAQIANYLGVSRSAIQKMYSNTKQMEDTSVSMLLTEAKKGAKK